MTFMTLTLLMLILSLKEALSIWISFLCTPGRNESIWRIPIKSRIKSCSFHPTYDPKQNGWCMAYIVLSTKLPAYILLRMGFRKRIYSVYSSILVSQESCTVAWSLCLPVVTLWSPYVKCATNQDVLAIVACWSRQSNKWFVTYIVLSCLQTFPQISKLISCS